MKRNSNLYDEKHNFVADELGELPKNTQNEIIAHVENITKNELWNRTQWIADYRRLRAIACKI